MLYKTTLKEDAYLPKPNLVLSFDFERSYGFLSDIICLSMLLNGPMSSIYNVKIDWEKLQACTELEKGIIKMFIKLGKTIAIHIRIRK